MQTQYVRVVCDISGRCSQPARYRVYVNEELFSERTWIWKDIYLEESLQIQAPFGAYLLRFENVDPDCGNFKMRNVRVQEGPGKIKTFNDKIYIEVHDAMA